MKKAKQKLVTINGLWKETGIDRRTIENRLRDAKVVSRSKKETRSGIILMFDHAEALRVITTAGTRSDNESSLEYKRRILKAEAEMAERKNNQERKIEDETFLKYEDVEKVLSVGLAQLEQVMAKLQSEFNLAVEVVKRGNELMDDARAEWAKLINKK